MVKELMAEGVRDDALLAEVMRLTCLPMHDAAMLIDIETGGTGDLDRHLVGPSITEIQQTAKTA